MPSSVSDDTEDSNLSQISESNFKETIAILLGTDTNVSNPPSHATSQQDWLTGTGDSIFFPAPGLLPLSAFKNTSNSTTHTVADGIELMEEKKIKEMAAAKTYNFVIQGRKTQAIQCAVQNSLWAEALALARYEDPQSSDPSSDASLSTSFNSVLSTYAQQTFPSGHPLLAVYCVLADRNACLFKPFAEIMQQRSSTKSSLSPLTLRDAPPLLQNWRSCAAAVVSSVPFPSARAFLMSLSDALAMYNQISAAHALLLMIKYPNDNPFNPASRMILVGADHRRS
jgi:hypothetical protein